jgi:hypothetical protein
MDDLFPLPDTWRSSLEAYPREIVLGVLAGVTFLLLVAIVQRPRAVLRGLIAILVLGAAVVALGVGTRAGYWADRTGQRDLAVLAIAGGVLLLTLLRLVPKARKHITDRRLVDSVRDDPQRLVVLAVARELGVQARMRAVRALDDPFGLDAVARGSRTEKVKRLAKRRLAKIRKDGRRVHETATDEKQRSGAESPAVPSQENTRPARSAANEKLLPENFFLPPDDQP